MSKKYLLRVTAGPTYDPATHLEIPVNAAAPTPPAATTRITSDLIDAAVRVRIRDYAGLPRDAPASSAYFDAEPHAANGDRYSIGIRFRLKTPPRADAALGVGGGGGGRASGGGGGGGGGGEDDDDAADGADTKAAMGVSGHDLQFGNDLDRPIRDRLPPGFGTAMRIVRWWVDPGLEGDAYADRPHLYGPALSSLNVLRVVGGGGGAGGDWDGDEEKGPEEEEWVETEGGDEVGMRERHEAGMPDGSRERMKWALGEAAKDAWVWRFGREYRVDFFNPYLDFADFSLRLPGFHLPVMRWWDGQGLRYVLRNRSTGQVYLVILFMLYREEDVAEDGSIKPAALEATARGEDIRTLEVDSHGHGDDGHEHFDEEKVLEYARRKLSGVDVDDGVETSQDDVD